MNERKLEKILVIGLGVTGKAAAAFLLRKGFSVIGVDKKEIQLQDFPELKGLEIGSESDLNLLDDVAQVILSPGIPSHHPLVVKAHQNKIEVIGEIELAFRNMHRPMIGITGTNGKTTVTALVHHVLTSCGLKASALGNIGKPLITEVDEEGIAVIELSSYQLETIHTPKLLAAVILNITPDHLDRYKTLDVYAGAKYLIQGALLPNGKFYVEADTGRAFESFATRSQILYSWQNAPLPLPGLLAKKRNHDAENLIAAYLLTRVFGIAEEDFLKAAESFQKAPHRIEFVRELAGVRYWNDSKGTNIDATLKAVEVMEGPVILIAGGVDKGSPYSPWTVPFKGIVKHVICIGEAAGKIKTELENHYPVTLAENLAEALEQALIFQKRGDNILLSPGCSSYDMFRDYGDRGDQFKCLVRSLT